jgi:hypothetical protein
MSWKQWTPSGFWGWTLTIGGTLFAAAWAIGAVKMYQDDQPENKARRAEAQAEYLAHREAGKPSEKVVVEVGRRNVELVIRPREGGASPQECSVWREYRTYAVKIYCPGGEAHMTESDMLR